MDRRLILKAATGLPVLLSTKKMGYGAEMTGERKTFAIKGFDSAFSTVIDENLVTHQLREYDGTYAPLIKLSKKNSSADFLVEIACFEAKIYADALSMGLAIAGVWGGRNIDFDKKNLSFVRAIVTYRENEQNSKSVRLHIFKNVNHFVIFCITYGENTERDATYKIYEEKLTSNFKFEKKRDNASQVSIIQLDSRSRILLPFDWKYRDVSARAREDFDPKGTVTRAYYFEHKERPAGALPNIVLAHYRDDIENARYLLDTYKEQIVAVFTNPPTAVFGKAEIITHRNDDEKIILQSLVIKLHDSDNQSLPMEVRATLVNSSITDGCYMLYNTGATVTDGRIREANDLNLINAWMVLDVMGASMERLLFRALSQGLSDYPQMFD